jgi:hypothetical protein
VSGTLIKVLVPSLFPSLELSACLPAASSGLPSWYAAECIPRRQLATRHERPGKRAFLLRNLERETGFEPATSTLARSHSTTELLPLSSFDYKQALWPEQRRAANEANLGSLLLRTGKQIRDK